MAAGIAEALLPFSGGETWLEHEGARPFPMPFANVRNSGGIALDASKKLLGFGQPGVLKELADGGSEVKNGEFLFRKSDRNFIGGTSPVNGDHFGEVGGLLGRAWQRRRREQFDGIGPARGQVMQQFLRARHTGRE